MRNEGWINKETKEVLIEDIPYSVNLEWRNKQNASGVAPRITRKLAKDNIPHDNIDIYFPFVGSDKMYAQIGYGKSDNVSKKSKSLAASLLLSKGGKWVGLFKVNETQDYLIFINDDLIDPDGDILLDSDMAEEIFKEICQENELTKEQIVMEISSPESGQEALSDILNEVSVRKRPTYRNIDIKFKMIHPIFYIVPLLGLVAIGGYGYIEYKEGVREAEIEAEKQRKQVAEYREKEILNKEKEEEEYKEKLSELKKKREEKINSLFNEARQQKEKPWQDEVNSVELFEYCIKELKDISLFKSTWRLRNASCNANNIESMYTRGDIVNVNNFLSENDNAIIDMIGESATFRENVDNVFSRSEDDIPNTPSEYKQARYSLIGSLQNRNVTYNIGSSAFETESTSGDESVNYDNEMSSDMNISGESILDQIRNARGSDNVSNSNNNQNNGFENNDITYKEQYENLLERKDVEEMTIEDIPDEKLAELENILQTDWQTQQVSISTTSTLDWFKNIIPLVKGLRIKQINVNISSSSQVEWELIGTFYFKESSNI